ncbi:YwqG family protein [Evansella clarkii]|uniref:YwqG family protein n=1 Tax=Evansella clarkii TaxID=79879 RepID=UPI0009989892|nr:YwqG family protein [Evansella clarkii]
MSDFPELQIPKELELYRKQIESTVKPFISITARKGETTVFQSKFGGDPYLPLSMEHPRDSFNKPMKLLAQFNLGEIPVVKDIPIPGKGILQFFISAGDDVMGIDFDDQTNQKNFRIVYHQEIEKDESRLVKDFSYIEYDPETDSFPVEYETALTFSVDHEPVSLEDHRNGELLGESVDLDKPVHYGEQETDLFEVYNEAFPGGGHKIGGYPFFTQQDPRDYGSDLKDHEILLLQIDSDFDNGIMWGDMGVANFFIKKEDLRNLDFSMVAYNWDCH